MTGYHSRDLSFVFASGSLCIFILGGEGGGGPDILTEACAYLIFVLQHSIAKDSANPSTPNLAAQ